MAGLASLPVSVGIVLAANVSTKLVERFAPRVVAVPGLLIAAVGMYLLSLLSPDSSYFSHVLPALFVTYFGLGMGFLPLTLTAVQGVYNEQTGAASAMLNASQQIGAALGVSVLGTISTLVSVRLLPHLVIHKSRIFHSKGLNCGGGINGALKSDPEGFGTGLAITLSTKEAA
jgi:predicted MFS family arabinose efflux permease